MINATLSDLGGSTSAQAFVHFELFNCGYNYPVVSNASFVPVRTTFDLKPNTVTGTIVGQVIGILSPMQPFLIASNLTWTPASLMSRVVSRK
jgi:hypothetical protein